MNLCLPEATRVTYSLYQITFAGVHYTHTEGTLVFESGEKEKDIKIPVIVGEVEKRFSVYLSHPEVADLHKKRAVCDVYFVADRKFGLIVKMVQSIVRRQNKARDEGSPWTDQFKEAIIPGGASVVQEGQGSKALQPLDYVLHFVSFSWKVCTRSCTEYSSQSLRWCTLCVCRHGLYCGCCRNLHALP